MVIIIIIIRRHRHSYFVTPKAAMIDVYTMQIMTFVRAGDLDGSIEKVG